MAFLFVSRQPRGVADQAGADALGDGGRDEHGGAGRAEAGQSEWQGSRIVTNVLVRSYTKHKTRSREMAVRWLEYICTAGEHSHVIYYLMYINICNLYVFLI